MTYLQNTRIFRFIIIIGIVISTIFIYASYYSNASMGVPGHIRNLPTLLSSSSAYLSNKYLVNITDKSHTIVDPRNTGRNENKLTRNNSMVRGINNIESSLQNVSDKQEFQCSSNSCGGESRPGYKAATGTALKFDGGRYVNASPVLENSKSNLNSTLNFHKIDLNFDKILVNLTVLPNSAPFPSSDAQHREPTISKKHNEQYLIHNSQKLQGFTSSSIQPSAALPPSALRAANRIKTSYNDKKNKQTAIDPIRGIQTQKIYESGHIDVNPQLCPGEGEFILLMVLITSAQSHYDARLAIRQTWGHYGTRRDIAMAFILGRTNNQTLENSLNQENYIYGDLIRGNFIDSYNNLTLKTISALEWVDSNCQQAKFVLKTDDDMFINIPKLMVFLEKHQKQKRSIYGRLAKKWKPIRNKKSKYYVSTGQFAALIFPPFTTGPAYVMTSDVVHDLYVKALEQTYLKLEDVFTTGIVAQQLGIKRVHVNEFLNRRIAFNPCNIRKTISVHMIKSYEQFDLWKKLLDQTTKCK